MSTIDERWNIVDTTRAFCQKVLPLVYDESLSYMEMVCKMSSKLNKLIENNNNLPQYIKNLIKETVNSDDFRQIVGSVLMDTIINVKFPPEGITPAKGDGVADDTSSIQACFDYANNLGGAVVFFPSGKYLTGPLSINTETSILGADRYNTSLVLKGGGNMPLLQGAINQSVRNISLDGNRLNQVEENYLIDGTIDMALFDNVIFRDSAHCITAETCNNSEFCNVLCKDIGDGIFITAAGNNNLLTNINTEYAIYLTGNNNNWQSQQQTKISNIEPLMYQKPKTLNRYFDFVTMQNNGVEYKVLVEGNQELEDINNSEISVYRAGRLLEERTGFITDTSNAYGSPQGACMVENIITQALLKSDNDCKFKRFNADDGTVISENIVTNLGHCSTLFYYNGTIIVTNGTNKTFYVLDYNNFSILETHEIPHGNTENLVAVLRDESRYYAINTTQLIVCDLEFNLINIYSLPPITKPVQSATLYDGYIYIISSAPEKITKIDLKADLINRYLLPILTYDGHPVGELESINFYQGNCVLTSFASSGMYQPLWFTNILITNLNETVNFAYTLDVNVTYPGNSTIYIDSTKNIYNPTGSQSKPFKTLGEALTFAKWNTQYNTVIYLSSETDFILFSANIPKLTINGNYTKFKTIDLSGSNIVLRDCVLDNTILPNYNLTRNNINNCSVKWGNFAVNPEYGTIKVSYSFIKFVTLYQKSARVNDINHIYFNMIGSDFSSNFLITTITTDEYSTSEYLVKESVTRIGDQNFNLAEPYKSNESFYDIFKQFKCIVELNLGGFNKSKVYYIPREGGYITESIATPDGIIVGTFFLNPGEKTFTRTNQYKISTDGTVAADTTGFLIVRNMYGIPTV